ncbi:MAG: hypothetical protein Q9188_004549 [Gyalolechia gomerana]
MSNPEPSLPANQETSPPQMNQTTTSTTPQTDHDALTNHQSDLKILRRQLQQRNQQLPERDDNTREMAETWKRELQNVTNKVEALLILARKNSQYRTKDHSNYIIICGL